ncbi:hypothetical protein [Pseudobutyrivibrio sp. MD2005]|uniref:hypothetical protein n=1 Tax=Pseudobutyrivibrio sp. MD2005 TaxID=1410616 RepID=UPI000486EABC|nr:hypothetical protein [Pseudobutyrivibrio sp. MD2005]
MKNLKIEKRTIIVLAIELIVFFILVGIMFASKATGTVYSADLKTFSTENDSMIFYGDEWRLDAVNGERFAGNDKLIHIASPNISLGRGTYTIEVNYNATEIQKGVIEAGSGTLEAADYFILSNNTNVVRYDFAAATPVKDFRFCIKEYAGGEFELTDVKIIRNSHDSRVAIFSWIVLAALFNVFYFSKRIKNRSKAVFIVCVIGLLASLPLFSKGMMTGNDIRFHLLRIEAIASGIKSGELPVRMYSVFNDGYGYPVGIFYGDFLLYVPAVLRIIGFPVIQSYKIFIFMINIMTAAISYWCGNRIFKKNAVAYIFATAFTLSTYRLICVYARSAVGEFSATCFYPIVMLAVYQIYTANVESRKYKNNAMLLAIGMSGLIYTHVLSTEMAIIVLFIIAIVNYKKTFRAETIKIYIKAIGICALLSASFIVPFVEYCTSVNTMLDSDEFKSTYIQSSGAYVSEYFSFFKSITGGNYANRRGLMTPGLLLMIALVLGIYLWAKKKANRTIKFTVVGSVLCLLVASNVFPWNKVYEIPAIGPVLVSVQFPYRYLGIAVCFLSLLLGFCVEQIAEEDIFDQRVFRYIIAISVIMTCYFAGQYEDEQYISAIINSYDTADLLRYTRYDNMGISIGFEYLLDGTNASKEALDYGVYGDNVNAVIVAEDGLGMVVYADAGADATLEVPRFAYPHFYAEDNSGNRLESVKGHNNKITVLFEKPYSGEVYIKYQEPWSWRVAELCSLLSICILIVLTYKKIARKG